MGCDDGAAPWLVDNVVRTQRYPLSRGFVSVDSRCDRRAARMSRVRARRPDGRRATLTNGWGGDGSAEGGEGVEGDGVHGAAEVAGHRVGHAQRVPDGFLHRFGGGEEEWREVVGGQGGDGDR